MSTDAPQARRVTNIVEWMPPDWSNDPTDDWVAYAWGRLVDAGLVPSTLDALHPNYVDHAVTAAALVYLGDAFGGCDQPSDLPDTPDLEEIIDPIALGRHAERANVAPSEAPESFAQLGAAAVRQRMTAVARALSGELGQSVLFADLWAQRLGEVDEYPLDNDQVDGIVNAPTPDKMIAWEWLDGLLSDTTTGG